MVHSTFLLDLRRESSRDLAFYPPHPDYSWAFDDIMVFAFSARQTGQFEDWKLTTNYYICSRAANTTRNLHCDELRTVSDFSDLLVIDCILVLICMCVLLYNTEGSLWGGLVWCMCVRLRQMTKSREKWIHVFVLTVHVAVWNCATISVLVDLCVWPE